MERHCWDSEGAKIAMGPIQGHWEHFQQSKELEMTTPCVLS